MRRAASRSAAVSAAAAALLAIGFAALTPSTHGAFSAAITGTGAASLNPWFGCHELAGGTASSAVFAYGLDDPDGTTSAADLSAHGSTGTYSAPVRSGQGAGAPCRRDGSRYWLPGGTTDLATQPLRLPTNFAYETWFRTANPNRVLMSIELPNYGSVALAIDGSGGLVLGGLGTEFLRVPAAAADDRWHHLVMDAGNGSLAFWLDGTLLGGNGINVPDGLTVIYHVGTGTPGSPSSVSSAQPFDGALRYAAMYSSVLTPDQIAQHRAAGLAGPGPTASATPGATATASATPVPTASASSTPVVTAAPDQPADQPAGSAPASSAPAASTAPSATASPTAVGAEQPEAGPDISTTGEQAPTG